VIKPEPNNWNIVMGGQNHIVGGENYVQVPPFQLTIIPIVNHPFFPPEFYFYSLRSNNHVSLIISIWKKQTRLVQSMTIMLDT